MGTAEEPYEGKVPIEKIEDLAVKIIDADRKKGVKAQYLFDSFPLHTSAAHFHEFASDKVNSASPDYIFDLRNGGVDVAASIARHKKRSELEEVSEDLAKELTNAFTTWGDKVQAYLS